MSRLIINYQASPESSGSSQQSICLCTAACTHRHKRVTSHMNESCHTEHIELPAKLLDYFLRSNESNINQYEWVITRVNESCHTWTSHVTYQLVMPHMNESGHTWTSHVTKEWVISHMNEPCHIRMSPVTYGWVMSYLNETCHMWTGHVA